MRNWICPPDKQPQRLADPRVISACQYFSGRTQDQHTRLSRPGQGSVSSVRASLATVSERSAPHCLHMVRLTASSFRCCFHFFLLDGYNLFQSTKNVLLPKWFWSVQFSFLWQSMCVCVCVCVCVCCTVLSVFGQDIEKLKLHNFLEKLRDLEVKSMAVRSSESKSQRDFAPCWRVRCNWKTASEFVCLCCRCQLGPKGIYVLKNDLLWLLFDKSFLWSFLFTEFLLLPVPTFVQHLEDNACQSSLRTWIFFNCSEGRKLSDVECSWRPEHPLGHNL